MHFICFNFAFSPVLTKSQSVDTGSDIDVHLNILISSAEGSTLYFYLTNASPVKFTLVFTIDYLVVFPLPVLTGLSNTSNNGKAQEIQ